jgi:hypothetical protein
VSRVLPGCLVLILVALAPSVTAKEHALRSPSGRTIYRPHETFEDVLDQTRRRFVAEVAAGAGPEGTLALLLGALNVPVDNLDVYVGFGLESNPARLYSTSMRYTLRIGEARPYVGVGYFLKDTYAVGLRSHNLFAELGYRWVLHRTYHLLIGGGLRRILQTRLTEGSRLLEPEIDPAVLDTELEAINPWLPTFVVRFSRAF